MNKLEKLQQTKDKLKSEFVGLDKIIDRIIDSITPWYITPEILERPTVVSLWGLTGTGKTSLIRKLVKYLDISGKSLYFDCGEQGGDSGPKLFSDKLDELFESSLIKENDPRYTEEDLEKLGLTDDTEQEITRTDPLDYVFIFDEFQYLKTKDPNTGDEESRPEGRAIWNLMDSGTVDINMYNYRIKQFLDYYEDLEFFSESHPGVKLDNGRFPESLSPVLKQNLSYYRWAENDNENVEDKTYKVIFDEDFSFIVKKLNVLRKGLGFEVGDKIKTLKTLGDFIIFMKDYVNLLSRPKVINCSKSLVFVLGNLDEAFGLTGDDLDPDIDADVYHEMTSKVTCIDIKTALRKRFRDEQVGRLGNNIIIYPSLRRKDFQEIIEREISRISEKFERCNGIKITITDDLKRLIYSEGCFPIQGVRPLFSTINFIISPLLSMILMSGIKKDVILDVKEKNFNVPKVTLYIEGIGEKEINLNLGELRSPERCKKLGLQSVHESSHAVLYHILTGKYPSALIASNIFGDGGYMMNEVNKDFSTGNIKELKEDVIVSLAGYYGEREFFDNDMCSLGSSSDLKNVWESLRDAYYSCGLHIPLAMSESNVSMENCGLPFGFPVTNTDVNRLLYKFFDNLCEETKRLVKKERYLIAKVSEYLLENRSMGVDVFKEFTKKYMKSTPKINDENYYKNIIKNE